jgi:hypothetical protein
MAAPADSVVILVNAYKTTCNAEDILEDVSWQVHKSQQAYIILNDKQNALVYKDRLNLKSNTMGIILAECSPRADAHN